ncbi:unnamed protein product [Oreochromis niloticus]|nr:unnamed protein product [Mustela putorius furo]
MEEELTQLRDLVAQLQAENRRMRQERGSEQPGTSAAATGSSTNGHSAVSAPATERLIYIPRERKCPWFNGKTGIGIAEWVEEVQACLRVRHLSPADQALFIYDHLEGEPREEIKYRLPEEKDDPEKILTILQELYGCTKSYVSLQEEFFSRRQQEGETLQEFSHALMCLMDRVAKQSPHVLLNKDVLLRDQFVENVLDCFLRRELKQYVRSHPTATLMDVRREAILWEREGIPGGGRGRSYSVPSVAGFQHTVQEVPFSSNQAGTAPYHPELHELKEILKDQQKQLNQLTRSLAALNSVPKIYTASRNRTAICRRCQKVGHSARECTGEPTVKHAQPAGTVAQSSLNDTTCSSNQASFYPPEASSQGSGGGSEAVVSNPESLVSACPYMKVLMGGVWVPCLVDTGSMVSTITESFFREHFESCGLDRLRSCNWLKLSAANGLAIPYIGYFELDVHLCGKEITRRGVLVVRDPPQGTMSAPGVLGMNVIRECYHELFAQHGSSFFNCPPVVQAPILIQQALQQCHQIQAKAPSERSSRVKVKGGRVCRVPGGTMKIVAATRSQHLPGEALFEPLSCGLPAGLLASPALLCVNRGTVYIPVVNVGVQDVVLSPHTTIGTLSYAHLVSSPQGLQEEGMAATVSSQTVVSSVQDKIAAIDLSTLTAQEQGHVRSLLYKYSGVFSDHDGDIGCTNLISHDIPLVEDTPVRQRYRRIPPSEYEAVKAHIRQLLEAQVIRESSSPFASPIVLVRKKDGSLRLCVDYRALNSKTRKDAFPLPRIDESLDALSGARWFSTLDLAAGYNQVPVTEKDKMKTAFCTPFGLFEWNRMPFGLCNAPSTFQRLMERIFGDQHCQSLLLYLDDVIVFSSTVEEHVSRLDVVLGRLQQEGLKAKLEKCSFFQSEVSYLGHVVSRDGVSTDPNKIEAVSKWPRPNHVSELHSFLGFASYYRRFVEGFAKLAAPLHRLVAELTGTKSRKPAIQVLSAAWTDECEKSFEGLKRRLVSAPVLAYANFSLPFILEVDASYQGLGAVLSQEQAGKIRPIAYASRGLRPTERNMDNYSSMKLEFLALKWAMTEKFRDYLLGQKCTVYTDNNPLSHLSTAKLGATEQRWAAQLAAFDFTIKYRPGRSNKNADALSRQHPAEVTSVNELGIVSGTALPAPLQQVFGVKPLTEAVQATISVFPGHAPSDLRVLQEADPIIQEFLTFWIRRRGPDATERGQTSREVLGLVRQWRRPFQPTINGHRQWQRCWIQEPVAGSTHDWVVEHQTRLRHAFEHANKRLGAAANWRKMRHDQHVRDAPLQEGAADEASSQEQKDGGEPANVERGAQIHLTSFNIRRRMRRVGGMKIITDVVGDPAEWYEKNDTCYEEGNSRSQSHFAPLPFAWHKVHKMSPSHTKQNPKDLNDNGNDDKNSGSLHVFS